MPDDRSSIISGHVKLAWEDFVAEADRVYPAAEWPGERLQERRNELLDLGRTAAEEGLYRDASQHRAEARTLAAVLAERGDASFDRDAEQMQLDMARVIVGEGPEPRIVTSRNPDTHENIDRVVNDPESNLWRLAEWSEAARFAMPYCLTDVAKEELGISTTPVGRVRDPAEAVVGPPVDDGLVEWMEQFAEQDAEEEPEAELEIARDHGPDIDIG